MAILTGKRKLALAKKSKTENKDKLFSGPFSWRIELVNCDCSKILNLFQAIRSQNRFDLAEMIQAIFLKCSERPFKWGYFNVLLWTRESLDHLMTSN